MIKGNKFHLKVVICSWPCISERWMMYLPLITNSSLSFFPENNPSSFTTKLPNMIELEGDWKLALDEIVFPKTWYNIGPDEVWFEISPAWNRVALRPGYYPTVASLYYAFDAEMKKHVLPILILYIIIIAHAFLSPCKEVFACVSARVWKLCWVLNLNTSILEYTNLREALM